MSATRLVDRHTVGFGTPNPWLHAEAARGIEIQLRDEIAEAQHRIRTLIEERDKARIDAATGTERVKQLKHAMSFVSLRCDYVHHPKKYQHEITEPCPVEELIRKAKDL